MLDNTLFLPDYSVVLSCPVFRCPKNIDFTGFFHVFLWQRSLGRGIFKDLLMNVIHSIIKKGDYHAN